MRDEVVAVMSVSAAVVGETDAEQRTAAIAEALQALVPAAVIGRAELGIGDRTAVMAASFPGRVRVADAARRLAAEHPIGLQLMRHPDARSALRMSDVVPALEWRRHPVYNELFRPLGLAHELVAPLPSSTADRQRGWVWIRPRGADFADAERALADRLQPLLAAIDMAPVDIRSGGDQADDADTRAEVLVRAALTDRELEVLHLLPTGMTAQQIGFVLRISPRTVAKHLEHVYDKLGVHDRVSAVMRTTRATRSADPRLPGRVPG